MTDSLLPENPVRATMRAGQAAFGLSVRLARSPDIARVAEQEGCTRSRAGMLRLGELLNGAVVVVGNAPTALLALLELCETRNLRPALVVGMPVGLVDTTISPAPGRLSEMLIVRLDRGSPL